MENISNRAKHVERIYPSGVALELITWLAYGLKFRLLCGSPQGRAGVEVSRQVGQTKHLERRRRGRWREYKDRGVGGQLSREMRAPPAPCWGWVGRDISNLLKLIASQTLSSPALPVCGEAHAQTVECYDEWAKCQGLETQLRSSIATLHLIFCLSVREKHSPSSSGMLVSDIFFPEE